MTVPTAATYSVDSIIAAHTAFRDLVDAGAGPGSITVRDAAGVLLAQVPLTDPSGAVNGTTGQLTLTASGRDESANANGTASYGEVCDSTGAIKLALPAQAGGSAVSGKIVLNTLTILAGMPVEVVSITIG